MKIVFIGASIFGLKCLHAIRDIEGCEIAGVVTAPQSFKISYNPDGVKNVLYADIASYCADADLPCTVMDGKMNDPALWAQVQDWEPDIFLVSGWYHMIPKKWRDLAPAYGLHASLLPDYSGGAPLVWAIINGERETGITLFQFDEGVDSGPIVDQAKTPIEENDTIATLYARIEELGVDIIRRSLPKLRDGTADHRIQDESKRRLVPQRSPEDGVIDWNKPATELYDFIRAQTKPYPGAFSYLNGQKITLWSVRPVASADFNELPGTALIVEGEYYVTCADGTALVVKDISVNGTDGDITQDLWSGCFETI